MTIRCLFAGAPAGRYMHVSKSPHKLANDRLSTILEVEILGMWPFWGGVIYGKRNNSQHWKAK